MKIVNVKIEKLKPSEYNPRTMTQKQVDDLIASIKIFGMVDPIIVNSNKKRNNIVVGGHQRLRIAKILKHKTIPVTYIDLNEEQEKELNLRLNRNNGSWAWDALANFDEGLLEHVGFEPLELSKISGEDQETPKCICPECGKKHKRKG